MCDLVWTVAPGRCDHDKDLEMISLWIRWVLGLTSDSYRTYREEDETEVQGVEGDGGRE